MEVARRAGVGCAACYTPSSCHNCGGLGPSRTRGGRDSCHQHATRNRSFRPDLIMISAGFDGHTEDAEGNRGWCHLLEEDYEWITDRLCEVAAEHSRGRIVSVLEGGYHVPQRRGRKGDFDTKAVLSSALATSCAAHVRSLVKG
mmetsp:Transcript_10121/g.23668  ORF Transcript_10121/g.23668 Transcript_10121/m.23668 type:complete len:144 (+) Transcript_10121:1739-2170(+)